MPYNKETLMETARDYYYRFGDRDPKPEEFKVFDKRDRHPDWVAKAEPVVKRVHAMWASVGMHFSLDDVMQNW
ncbi:MAG TPA: hypothetical protein ENJ64_02280 [Thiotrichales bacterium]|nr:hypothetical protein [Thiotrichales bacterium]